MRSSARWDPDREAFLLGRIVQSTQAAAALDRATEEERLGRVYFSALLSVLDAVLRRSGGAGVGDAFESTINAKARQLDCGFAMQKGRPVWKGTHAETTSYRKLLEDAIQYAKGIVPPSTVDRILGEKENHLDPSVIQAAVENNMRIPRSGGG
jgi:hypothetical protein